MFVLLIYPARPLKVIFAAFFFRPASLQILAVAELRLRFALAGQKNKFVKISPLVAELGIVAGKLNIILHLATNKS
jgi:hypothetical protein